MKIVSKSFYKVIILFMLIFSTQNVFTQQPGLQNPQYNSVGNFKVEHQFPDPEHILFPLIWKNDYTPVGMNVFCRPVSGNLTVNWKDLEDYELTQTQFLKVANGQTGNSNGKEYLIDLPSSKYLLMQIKNYLSHRSQKHITEMSMSCDLIKDDDNVGFFRLTESSYIYNIFHKALTWTVNLPYTYFGIDTVFFQMDLDGSGWQTLSRNTGTVQASTGETTTAYVESIGGFCINLYSFDRLKFIPEFFPSLANGQEYNIYRVREIISYDCSTLNDTLEYHFYVYQKIKNIDFTIGNPCSKGVTNNGMLTLDFNNRIGGRFVDRNNNPLNISHFDFQLLRDGSFNGFFDGCHVNSYTFNKSTQSFTNLPAGDYLLKVECNHPDFNYGYTYYDTIIINPSPSEFEFETQYFICPSEEGVTLNLGEGFRNITWTSSCFSLSNVSNAAQTFQRGTSVTVVATSNASNCILRDTTTIVDLSGFDRKLNILDSVINISATEYSSNWPPAYMQMSWDTVADLYHYRSLPAYQKGSAGIYRPVQAYDYFDRRIQTKQSGLPQVLLKGDGVINEVKFFDWMYGADASCLPKWILNATMTQYNSSGFDIENKDIFDIHSSALYGYRNQLPVAVAANAKIGEIGFESFEEYLDTENLNQITNSSGNIDLVPEGIIANTERTERYTIHIGQGNFALLSAKSFQESNLCNDGWMDADLYIMIPDPQTGKINDFTISTRTRLAGEYCDDDFVIMEFPESIPGVLNPNECHHWRGELMLKQQISMTGYYLLDSLRITDEIAHTGKRSLYVPVVTQLTSTPLRISSRQHKVQLQHGKKYHISAWIHHSNITNYSSSALEGYNRDQGIGLNIKSGENEFFFSPSGKVINGWQKVSAAFIHTGNESFLDIFFSNVVPVYIDDIRLFPEDGNLQTYVYDPVDYRLRAVLDANNYATIYIYDAEGKVFAVKKETQDGILTLQQSNNYIKKNQ